MLIYDPTLDPYHCSIRILSILERCNAKSLPVESVRIADYYLAFPATIADMRLSSDHLRIRKISRGLINPYRNPLKQRAAFERMRPIFQAAVSSLIAAGFLDDQEEKKGVLARSSSDLPEALRATIESFVARQRPIREFIVKELTAIPLLGPSGLKDRSGLMEHRYDPI
ncbi:ABC-three component system middle component 5 [Sulfuritalea sp.]|uniref:ABC-three component system middle component 5 n=1 Tax=Sulfuritalea sp. TaxID=2480090 RepID=UPI00286DE965|nr:ABC-three component system middle component 5 [Sulfuritalea sp.]